MQNDAITPEWLSGEWAGESIPELLGDLLDGRTDDEQEEIKTAYVEAADSAFTTALKEDTDNA